MFNLFRFISHVYFLWRLLFVFLFSTVCLSRLAFFSSASLCTLVLPCYLLSIRHLIPIPTKAPVCTFSLFSLSCSWSLCFMPCLVLLSDWLSFALLNLLLFVLYSSLWLLNILIFELLVLVCISGSDFSRRDTIFKMEWQNINTFIFEKMFEYKGH